MGVAWRHPPRRPSDSARGDPLGATTLGSARPNVTGAASVYGAGPCRGPGDNDGIGCGCPVPPERRPSDAARADSLGATGYVAALAEDTICRALSVAVHLLSAAEPTRYGIAIRWRVKYSIMWCGERLIRRSWSWFEDQALSGEGTLGVSWMIAALGMARKLTAGFSDGVPTRRHSLNQPAQHSVALRLRYSRRANVNEGPRWRAAWSERWGITAPIERRRSHVRSCSKLYPLSPATRPGRGRARPLGRGVRTASIGVPDCVDPCVWPGMVWGARGGPRPSVARRRSVLDPSVERPRTWPGVLGCPPSPRSGRRPAAPHRRAVDAPDVPVDLPLSVQTGLEGPEHPVPGSVAAPSPEPVVNRLPEAMALRQVAPCSARAQEPEYGLSSRLRAPRGWPRLERGGSRSLRGSHCSSVSLCLRMRLRSSEGSTRQPPSYATRKAHCSHSPDRA